MGSSPWGREEWDTTERLPFHLSLSCTGDGNGTHSSALAWRTQGRGSLVAAVYSVAQSQTRLKRLSSSSVPNDNGDYQVLGKAPKSCQLVVMTSV